MRTTCRKESSPDRCPGSGIERAVRGLLAIGPTLGALVLSLTVSAQTLPPPTVGSPNAASLEKFGDVPVNLFTGTPDISIPIHTLNYGKISVPISLRYHPGSLRVAQQAGWVGEGSRKHRGDNAAGAGLSR
jgi:hypothetical protein